METKNKINDRKYYISATRRAFAIPLIAIPICMLPFLVGRDALKGTYLWLLERGFPFTVIYTNQLSSTYSDWQERVVSIHIALLLSPILVLSGWYFTNRVIVGANSEYSSTSLSSKIYRSVALLCLMLIMASVCILIPGADMVISKEIPNTFGLKSSLISVAGFCSLGFILGLFANEIRNFNKA